MLRTVLLFPCSNCRPQASRQSSSSSLKLKEVENETTVSEIKDSFKGVHWTLHSAVQVLHSDGDQNRLCVKT